MIAALALFLTVPAQAELTNLTGIPLEQQGAAHAVGCSLEEAHPVAAINYYVHGSFVVDAPQPATVVRIVFAITDELGDHHFISGIENGKFSPGVRIDGGKWNGRGAVRHFRGLQCYISEARLADGTVWHSPHLAIPELPPAN